MREPRPAGPKGRIIIHDSGAGVPSPDMIRQRARELAVIAGRAGSEYTEEDFRQAKAELIQAPEIDEETLPFEPGSGDVLGGRDHQSENFGPEDESSVSEELVREGLEEALHDEMLEASKKRIREGI